MFSKAAEYLKSHIGKEITDSPSPFMAWLKPVILAVEDGSLTFQHTIRKEMTNPFGTLHGGITAAIIDDAIGATLISYGEPYFYVSVNLVVDYLSAAREGDIILAQTSIIKKGSQIVNAQCEVWNADRSKLIAKGYTNLLKTEIKK
ncbi:thioesterase [Flavobacterium psychrophilum]|nr:thioesterase [Flavobacterium psychrophilum]AOE52515.1 thioesterase [Flavobacterium psychrophilum]